MLLSRPSTFCALALAFASAHLCWAQPIDRSMITDIGNSTERVEITFPYRAVAVPNEDRVRLASALATVRRDWCSVEVVISVAHSDASEGVGAETIELAKRRAQYTHDLLHRLGVNETLMFLEARGASRPLHSSPSRLNARVEIEIVGRKCWSGPRTSGADLLSTIVKPVQTVRPWQEGQK